ncbi:hypothetical protein GCM10022217_31920 [Chryseobacterium ginsenosidimutans]|uniref:hypothetical protein n=1 Tax=Chryseobacterium ginsenosidimutans TaxID=687846 RepID=UPI0031D0DB81
MKKQLLSLTLLTVSFFSFAQQADKLVVLDTRSINDIPAAYSGEVKTEFKLRSILGVPGTGMYSGMFTISPWGDDSGNKTHQLNFNDGGVFYRNALPSDPQWGSWSKLIMQASDGTVRVDGKIIAKEIEVKLDVWADYVFQKYYSGNSILKPEYTMPTLEDVEKFTKENNHLPNVPSAKEIQEKGLNVGEMSNLLLQKIEELTLYTIEQNKAIKEQNETIREQQKRIEALEKKK